MADYITKQFCEKTNQAVMKEIKEVKDKVFEISLDLARLPEALAEKFDRRYAPIAVTAEIEEIKTRQDTNTTNIANRNYEWLKYLIMLGVGALMSYLFTK
jgi:hypothetical protein